MSETNEEKRENVEAETGPVTEMMFFRDSRSEHRWSITVPDGEGVPAGGQDWRALIRASEGYTHEHDGPRGAQLTLLAIVEAFVRGTVERFIIDAADGLRFTVKGANGEALAVGTKVYDSSHDIILDLARSMRILADWMAKEYGV